MHDGSGKLPYETVRDYPVIIIHMTGYDADKLGASEAAGIDLGLPFEEKRRVFEGGKSNGRRST